MSFLFLLLVTFASLGLANSDSDQASTDPDPEVGISAECASVLLAAGGVGGALTAYMFAPAAMCAAGFCGTGVAASSYAATWQASIPFVIQGSVFALLQSASMAGVGVKTYVAATAVGGAVMLSRLENFCASVDAADPESGEGKARDAVHTTLVQAVSATNKLISKCDASESCSQARQVVMDTATGAAHVANFASSIAVESLDAFWTGFKNGLSEKPEASVDL